MGPTIARPHRDWRCRFLAQRGRRPFAWGRCQVSPADGSVPTGPPLTHGTHAHMGSHGEVWFPMAVAWQVLFQGSASGVNAVEA